MSGAQVTLKPCPFCEGEAKLSAGYWFDGNWVWPTVRCQDLKCRAEKETKGTEAEAIAAWNERAATAEHERLLDMARGALEAVKTDTLGERVAGGDGGTYVVRPVSGKTYNLVIATLAAINAALADGAKDKGESK